MKLTTLLCSEFQCDLEGLQDALNTRDGIYKVTLLLKDNYDLKIKGCKQLYCYHGFTRFEKLAAIPEEGVPLYARLPDVVVQLLLPYRSRITSFPIDQIYCRLRKDRTN